ncbi:hypothetical protein GCM10028895_42100 [Pontibacter rugosus]
MIVQLSPTRNAKLSFTVQLILTLFWLSWAAMLLFSEESAAGQGYLYYVFFGLAVVFLFYVILQNTSVFGVQSYIEITQQYIVQKFGVFRTKHLIQIPDIASVHITPLALRLTLKDESQVYLDLKQVRKKRDLDRIKMKMREMAETHNYAVSDTVGNRI